jgi:hypothetical protein
VDLAVVEDEEVSAEAEGVAGINWFIWHAIREMNNSLFLRDRGGRDGGRPRPY